jgi:DHA2 family multidrug resistance protein
VTPLASDGRVKHHGLITLSVMLATIMQALDSTIANVALPRMQGTLAATQDQMSWVLTSYIIAAAITMPLTGWLAVRFERKVVFLVSIAGFTLASALCGLATSLPQMVLFRLLQGISGAALVPLSQAILFDINPPANFGKAMSIWGVGVTLGPILGPALGGWLTEDYNWRWVFYINLPIGVLAFGGLFFFLPLSIRRPIARFDFFGFAALSIGVGALQMMLDRGELLDWFSSTEILIEATLSGLGFYLFILQMVTGKQPFLNPGMFKDRNFIIGNLFIFLVGIVMFATLALVPPMLQNLMNYPVITTGLVTAPRGAGTMLGMLVVGRLVGRFDARLIMALGLALTALSLWQMTKWSLLMDETPIIVSGVIQGLGIGLVYVPLSTITFATLNPQMRTEGAAFFSLLRNVGSSIGISVVQFLFTQNSQINHSSLSEHASLHRFFAASRSALLVLNGQISRQAGLVAYIDDFQLMLVLTLLSIPLLLVFHGPKNAAKPSGHLAVLD